MWCGVTATTTSNYGGFRAGRPPPAHPPPTQPITLLQDNTLKWLGFGHFLTLEQMSVSGLPVPTSPAQQWPPNNINSARNEKQTSRRAAQRAASGRRALIIIILCRHNRDHRVLIEQLCHRSYLQTYHNGLHTTLGETKHCRRIPRKLRETCDYPLLILGV